MRPHDNPYTPNAGARPPALVGRDDLLESFEILLERLRRGHKRAIDADHRSSWGRQDGAADELRGAGPRAKAGRRLRQRSPRAPTSVRGWVQSVRRALFQLAPRVRWKERARRAAAVLKSFQIAVATDGTLSAGLDVDAAEGLADSGQLDDDLTHLLLALGEAAGEQDSGVVFLIDEVQFLATRESEALIAGAPQDGPAPASDHAGRGRSAAVAATRRRGEVICRAALQVPPDRPALPETRRPGRWSTRVQRLDVSYEGPAVEAIVDYTQGYPYFLQEYGNVLWDLAETSPITARRRRQCPVTRWRPNSTVVSFACVPSE